MKINKQQKDFLDKMIAHWEAKELIQQEQANTLKNTVEVSSFEWKKLASYAFGFAIFCLVVSVIFLVSDHSIKNIIEKIHQTSDLVFCIFFLLLGAFFTILGLRSRKKNPHKTLTIESFFFGGAISLAMTVLFTGKLLDNGSGHFSLLLLAIAICYFSLAWFIASKQLWLFGLLSLGAWFGTETAYLSGNSEQFLGMNYPLRYALFGLCMSLIFLPLKKGKFGQLFHKLSLSCSFLYLFSGLWLVSLTGNPENLDQWDVFAIGERWLWLLPINIVSLLCIFLGRNFQQTHISEFGFIFLLLSCYTRFFELCWPLLPKTAFFALLAISFWGLGKIAEKLWLKKKPDLKSGLDTD